MAPELAGEPVNGAGCVGVGHGECDLEMVGLVLMTVAAERAEVPLMLERREASVGVSSVEKSPAATGKRWK